MSNYKSPSTDTAAADATPIISNRMYARPPEQPPSLQLPGVVALTTNGGSLQLQHHPPTIPRVARFSNPNEAPIIMTSLSNNSIIKRDSQRRQFLWSSESIYERQQREEDDSCLTQAFTNSIRAHALATSADFDIAYRLALDAMSVLGNLTRREIKRLCWFLIHYGNSLWQQAQLDCDASATLRRIRLPATTSYNGLLSSTLMAAGGSRSSRPVVKGLRNYGQTCFLNAVLQSLAALDPFLVYLLRISRQLNTGSRELDGEDDDYDGDSLGNEDNGQEGGWQSQRWNRDDQEESAPTSTFPVELLELLLAVNDNPLPTMSNTQRSSRVHTIDPRPILLAVSHEYAQFRNTQAFYAKNNAATLEQQDAQELLQAILDMIVKAAGLDTTSSVKLFFDDDDKSVVEKASLIVGHANEILSAASGAKEASSVSACTSPNDVMDLPSAEEVICDDKDFHDCSSGSEVLFGNGVVPFGKYIVSQSADSSQSDSEDDYMTSNQDEKKQVDYLPHIPRVHSEESLQTIGQAAVSVQMDFRQEENVSPLATDSISSNSTSSLERNLSAAMRMMLSSTTSLTPSPFCGWLGSSLQCSGCKHVRPIQNAPFFDIPVIPTAVTKYLTGSARSARHVGAEPVKCSPASVGPPCTLEEMLHQFTEVERVQDVECRNCTLQREKKNAEEEITILEDGVNAQLSRAKRNAGPGGSTLSDDEDPAKLFRADLKFARQKLDALHILSPDEEGSLEQAVAMGNPLMDEDSPCLLVDRTDAFKRLLLTRLPSILAIHIQRRFYDPMTNQMSKTAQYVVFPEYLNAAPFFVYGGGGADDDKAEWAGSASSCSSGYGTRSRIMYRLQALIEHHGGAFHGHYVTYRRDPSNASWLYISDDAVRQVSWDQVRSRQAYMLFYEAI